MQTKPCGDTFLNCKVGLKSQQEYDDSLEKTHKVGMGMTEGKQLSEDSKRKKSTLAPKATMQVDKRGQLLKVKRLDSSNSGTITIEIMEVNPRSEIEEPKWKNLVIFSALCEYNLVSTENHRQIFP